MQQPPNIADSIISSSPTLGTSAPMLSTPLSTSSLLAPIDLEPITVVAVPPVNDCFKFKLQELLKNDHDLTEKRIFEGLLLPMGIPENFVKAIAGFLPQDKKNEAISFTFAFFKLFFLSEVCKDCSPGQETFFLALRDGELITQLYYTYAYEGIKVAIDKENGRVLCFNGNAVQLFFTVISFSLMQQMNGDAVYEDFMGIIAAVSKNCSRIKDQLEFYRVLQGNLRAKFYAKMQRDRKGQQPTLQQQEVAIPKTVECIRDELKRKIGEINKDRFVGASGKKVISKQGIARLVAIYIREGEQLADESFTLELHTPQEINLIEEKWNCFLGKITGIFDKIAYPIIFFDFSGGKTESNNPVLSQHSAPNVILYTLFRELFYIKKAKTATVSSVQSTANISSDQFVEELRIFTKKLSQFAINVSQVSGIFPNGAEINTLVANFMAVCEQLSQKKSQKQCNKKIAEFKEKYIQFSQRLEECTEAHVKTNQILKKRIPNFKAWLESISNSEEMADLFDDSDEDDKKPPKEQNQGASSSGLSASSRSDLIDKQILKEPPDKPKKKSKKKNKKASDVVSSTSAIPGKQAIATEIVAEIFDATVTEKSPLIFSVASSSTQSEAVTEDKAGEPQISTSAVISPSTVSVITPSIAPTILLTTEKPAIDLVAQIADIRKSDDKLEDDQSGGWQVVKDTKHKKSGISDRDQKTMLPHVLQSHQGRSHYGMQRQFKGKIQVIEEKIATKLKELPLAITITPKEVEVMKPVVKTTLATIATGTPAAPVLTLALPAPHEALSEISVVAKGSVVSSETTAVTSISDASSAILNHSRVLIPASPPLSPLTPLSLSPILGAEHDDVLGHNLDVSGDIIAEDLPLATVPPQILVSSQSGASSSLKTVLNFDASRASSPASSNLSHADIGSPFSPVSVTTSLQSFDATSGKLPEYLSIAKEVIEPIESRGYKAIVVGGAVISYLQGSQVSPSDIDLRTNMPRAELIEVYKVFSHRVCPYDKQLFTLSKYKWLIDIYCLDNIEYEERLNKLQTDSLIGEQVYWHPHLDTKKYPLLVQDEVTGVFSPPGDAIKRVKERNFMQNLDPNAVKKNPLLILRLLYRVVESTILLNSRDFQYFASYNNTLKKAILGKNGSDIKAIPRGQLLTYLKKFLTKDKFFNYMTTFERVGFLQHFLPNLHVNKWHIQTNTNGSRLLNYARNWFYDKLSEMQITFREQKIKTYYCILENYFAFSLLKQKDSYYRFGGRGVFNDMEKMANIIFDFLYMGDATKFTRSASGILEKSMIALNQLYIFAQYQQPNVLPPKKEHYEAWIAEVLKERQPVSGCKDSAPRNSSCSSCFFASSMAIQPAPSAPALSTSVFYPPPPIPGFANQEYYQEGYQELEYWNGAGFFPPPYGQQEYPSGQYCYFPGVPPVYT